MFDSSWTTRLTQRTGGDVVRVFRRAGVVLTIVAVAVAIQGCEPDGDDQETPPETEPPAVDETHALQLVVPGLDDVPPMELNFTIVDGDDEHVEALREPVGNVVYQAVRQCSEAHPGPDVERARAIAVDYVVEDGEVQDSRVRSPTLGGRDVEMAGEAARECVVAGVGRQSVDVPDGYDGPLADERFEVTAQVEVQPPRRE